MGMIETASRIIKRFGQTGTFERAGAPSGPPYAPIPGTPTFHTADVAVVDYSVEERSQAAIADTDVRALVSVEGLTITPTVADTLSIGGKDYSIVNVGRLAPDGVTRFYDLQVRR